MGRLKKAVGRVLLVTETLVGLMSLMPTGLRPTEAAPREATADPKEAALMGVRLSLRFHREPA
jgi:hypothetical protein